MAHPRCTKRPTSEKLVTFTKQQYILKFCSTNGTLQIWFIKQEEKKDSGEKCILSNEWKKL